MDEDWIMGWILEGMWMMGSGGDKEKELENLLFYRAESACWNSYDFALT